MRVAIGIPVADTLPGISFGHHIAAVVEVVKMFPDVVTITPCGLYPHDHARDVVVQKAIEHGCDLLWFIDDDTISPRGAFARLFHVLVEEKAQVVSGHYLRRGNPYTCVWSKEIEGQWFSVEAGEGVHEIHMTGLGCALVDLSWCRANLPADSGWFKMQQDDRRTMITDDTTFYRLVRRAGGKILGDAEVKCVHLGHPEMICNETATLLRKVDMAMENQIIGWQRKPQIEPLPEMEVAK